MHGSLHRWTFAFVNSGIRQIIFNLLFTLSRVGAVNLVGHKV